MLTQYFNSIKVRLELVGKRLQSGVRFHFNSIKVRLERSGDIVRYCKQEFQFHKGAIRTLMNLRRRVKDTHFNSIKVRLERPQGVRKGGLNKFQFHKGAIRTLGGFVNCNLFINFNSIKVRLEHVIFNRSEIVGRISIP